MQKLHCFENLYELEIEPSAISTTETCCFDNTSKITLILHEYQKIIACKRAKKRGRVVYR